jgi:hypothetical protein
MGKSEKIAGVFCPQFLSAIKHWIAVSSKSTEFSQVAVNPLNLQRLHSALCKSTSSFDWRQTNFKMPYHLKLSFGCILYNDMMHHMASPVFSDPNRDPMPLFSSQNLLPRCYLDSKFCDEALQLTHIKWKRLLLQQYTNYFMSSRCWQLGARRLIASQSQCTLYNLGKDSRLVAHAATPNEVTWDISFTRKPANHQCQTASSSWITFILWLSKWELAKLA